MNKDVAIFIDTNIAQTFIGGNVYFSKLGIPPQYYELTTFIEENRLNGRIEICFPETVVKEMKSHMIKGFVSANNAIVESICGFKKIYGDLLDIEFQVRIPEEEYPHYVESLFKDFFSNPRNCCKVVEHPRNNELIDVVEHFDTVCQSIFAQVYANGLENEQLASIRDALLPKLMSGEIDVSNIQI